MEFSVVRNGYDQDQIHSWLQGLRERLAAMAARAEAAEDARAGLARLREELVRVRGELAVPARAVPDRADDVSPAEVGVVEVGAAEVEAAEIVVRARLELAAARQEAERVREQAYDDAVQARREFESALHARRRREQQVDEILRGVRVGPIFPGPERAKASALRPPARLPRLWNRLTAHAR